MREKGFTLIELVVALAIIAIIAVGASASVFQLLAVSRQNNDISTAVRQAQNTGHWISRDALMAENITTTTPPTIDAWFIKMNWSDWVTGDSHEILYILRSSADPSYSKIERVENDESTFIADNIETLTLDDTWQTDETWILTVVTRAGKQSVTREYQITPRVGTTY